MAILNGINIKGTEEVHQLDYEKAIANKPPLVKSFNDLEDKPFYSEDGEAIIYDGANVEFEHVTEDEIGENYSLYLDTVIEPQTGYLIDWDGKTYSCTSTELMDVYVFLGNQSYMGGEDTGEPFFMMCAIDQIAIVTFDLTTNTHNVKIYQNTEIVHQLDPKYVDGYTKAQINEMLGVYVDEVNTLLGGDE